MPSRPISCLTLSLAFLMTLISTCLCSAQEVAFLDLTKVTRHVDLRRPKATSPVTGGYSGTGYTSPCPNAAPKVGALRTSLVSLDRTHYQVGDQAIFEVTVENAGSAPIRIPFSPHLSDLQHKDPAQEFAYSELRVVLWIVATEQWSTNSGGSAVLYGADDHENTMLRLNPGEWVRVIGKTNFALDQNALKLTVSVHPADHMYAQTLLYREKTLITPTQAATVDREVCLAQIQGQSFPMLLVMP